jgi:hypothetical protein
MLTQPAQSLTDLALGLVVLALGRRLPSGGAAARHWRAAFGWAATAALAGAVHHAWLVDTSVGDASWALTSLMVVVVLSYLLAASVVQVLGASRAVVFWPLRSLGLIAYVVVAALGHAGIPAIMWCESLTMAAIIGLWLWAARRGHPMARPVLIAILAGVGAAVVRLIPGIGHAVGLDANSAYHLAQIPGMVLLYRAVGGPELTPRRRPRVPRRRRASTSAETRPPPSHPSARAPR